MTSANRNLVVINQTAPEENTADSLNEVMKLLGGIDSLIQPGQTVLIKPNFVAPFEKAVTDLSIVKWVLDKVRECGAQPIIGESSGFEFNTGQTFQVLGLRDFAERNNVRLVNFDEGDFIPVPVKNYPVKNFLISKTVLDCDVLINLPKLKGHALTKVTFGMKNLFGVLHRETRRKIHAVDLETGIYKLNELITPDLTIVDGLWTLSRAVFSEPVFKGIIIAGRDVRKVDYECCKVFGIDYSEVKHIKMACSSQIDTNTETINISSKRFDVKPIAMKKRIAYKVHNMVYRSVYIVDLLYSRLSGSKSIIPDFHLNFGIKPKIYSNLCDKCGQCVKICPIEAINEQCNIDYSKCKYLRCFRCAEGCPRGAIKRKGFNRNGG